MIATAKGFSGSTRYLTVMRAARSEHSDGGSPWRSCCWSDIPYLPRAFFVGECLNMGFSNASQGSSYSVHYRRLHRQQPLLLRTSNDTLVG